MIMQDIFDKDRINQISPVEIAQRGLLFHSARGKSSDEEGYCCVYCTSGNGHNETGALNFKFKDGIWKHYCQACGNGGDNFYLFQQIFNCGYIDAGRRASEMFGIPLLNGQSLPTKSRKKSSSSKPAKPAYKRYEPPKDDTDPRQLPLIKADITEAKKHLDALPRDQRRGLTGETLQHFNCGYLQNWVHPKCIVDNIQTVPSRRIIIPTEGDTHYLALALPEDRKPGNAFDKPHAGAKFHLFNPDALKGDPEVPVFFVEGEVDAMSIWQVADHQFPVCAVISAAGWQRSVMPLIDAGLVSWRKCIILFDKDDTGIKQANLFQKALTERNFPAVVRFIYDFLDEINQEEYGTKVDANAILKMHGGINLAAILREIRDDAQKDFGNVKNQVEINFDDTSSPAQMPTNEVIAEWQTNNGIIDPELLPKLLDHAKIFLSTEITADFIQKESTQKYLGAFCHYSFLKFVWTNFKARARKLGSEKNGHNALPFAAYETLCAKVKDYAAQAKKAHNNFIKTHEIDLLNKKKQEQHEEYLKNTPTTKNFCPDCPIELLLPECVYFSNDGIIVEDRDKPFNEKRGGYPQTTACYNPVVPTRILRDPNTNNFQYEIAIRCGENGQWRRSVFPGKTLMDPRTVSELAQKGLKIADAKTLAKFFAMFISLNETTGFLSEVLCYNKPGWDEDTDRFILPTDGEDYIVRRTDIDYKKVFRSKGNPDEWIKYFLKCTNAHPVARYCAGLALVAPILVPLGLPNLQGHIMGNSSIGKSVLNYMCASIYGTTKSGYIVRTAEATNKNKMLTAVMYNCFFLAYEEGETMNEQEAKKFSASVYSYFEGVINQANKRDGTARQTETFSGTRLFTSERELIKINDKRGAMKRIASFYLSELYEEDFAKEMHNFFDNNYGHFGLKWVTDYVVPQIQLIKDRYNEMVKIFLRADRDATIVQNITASTVMYYCFLELLSVKAYNSKIVFDDIAENILPLQPSIAEMSDMNRTLAMLSSFVVENIKSFTREGIVNSNFGDEEVAYNAVTYGKIFKDGSVAFMQNALREIIEGKLKFPSADKFVRECADNNRLIKSGNRGNLFRCRIYDKRVDVYRITNLLIDAKHYEDDTTIDPEDVPDEIQK